MNINKRNRHQRSLWAATGIGVAALLLVGTSLTASAGSNVPATKGTVSVNVGTKNISLKLPMRIGMFTSAGTASFGGAEDTQMMSFAKAHNMKVTFFDAAFNSTTQFNQIQTAIQDKKFNVLVVLPVDGQTICKELSQTAPNAGLLVVDVDQPLCGRFTREGNALWQPGTLDYISGYDTKTTLGQYIAAIAKANPGPQTVGVVEGVASDGLSTNINNIVAATEKSDPNFKVVATANTDYSSEAGYTDTQSMLQAHPDISVIISSQSNITEGAARAISGLGDSKKVYLADYGGDAAVVALMKLGEVSLTTPTWPTLEGTTLMQVLINTSHGKKAQRLISLPFKVITPANVASYKPEY